MRTNVASRLVRSALTGALALGLTACGTSGGGGGGGAQTLDVLAASSLTVPFNALKSVYQHQHPDVTVKLVYDSSATLVTQLQQGAPGGVLATADSTTMGQAKHAKVVVGTPSQFATNTLVLAVPANNPAHITTFGDLNKPGVKFLTCVTTAPCGAYAAAMLKADRITAKPASEATDDASVLQTISQGEADAGLVYHSDIVTSGDSLKSLPIPGASAQKNQYFAAVTAGQQDPTAAKQWLALLRSQKGQAALRHAGFGKP